METDLHLHLYGCLSYKDLHEVYLKSGFDKNRVDFLKKEYFNAYNRNPVIQDYSDIEVLKADYIFKGNNFSKFQSSFNMIIALCPIVPEETNIINKAIDNLKNMGLKRAELRTVFPPYFDNYQKETYLSTLSNIAESRTDIDIKFLISLPRIPNLVADTIPLIDKFSVHISGIDFAFFEETTNPLGLKNEIKSCLEKNQKVTYHVGETFDTISIFTSLSWVMECIDLGIKRLGHCLTLGLNFQYLLGKTIDEDIKFKESTLKSFSIFKNILGSKFYDFFKDWNGYYTQEAIDLITELQNILIKQIKTNNVAIESCPISNTRIGNFKASAHPIKRFLDNELTVFLCQDDPGVFNTDSTDEIEAARKAGLTDQQINKMLKNADFYWQENYK